MPGENGSFPYIITSFGNNEKKGVITTDKNGILLDFYSKDCMPCRMMDPLITEFASTNENIEVRKIEASEAPDVFEKHGIRSVPTFIFMKDGREKGRLTGVCRRQDIERLVSEG